jgi:4-diphosphocytidyl-2-C-methyl-D-erythritol kinase
VSSARAALAEHAPAKVNLTLRVLGRRADGYHTLESLVAFAKVADRLTLRPGGPLELTLRGPTGEASGAVADNLVLKAARALEREVPGLKSGCFALTKSLPVAAGLGGGSADAAAALRLLARANRIALDDPRVFKAAGKVGADVPVCLASQARTMRGIGDRLSEPVELPRLPAVLVNPGIALSTKDVFDALGRRAGAEQGARGKIRAVPTDFDAFLTFLENSGNDLAAPAIELQPAIAKVLAALQKSPGCRLARMSGSGPTCFGLFGSSRAATAAARELAEANPSWWVKATVLG